MKRSLPFFSLMALLVLAITSCGVHPKHSFAAEQVPTAPNYSQDRFWAALPWQDDAADITPNGDRLKMFLTTPPHELPTMSN